MASRPIKKLKAGTSVLFRIEVRNAQADETPLFSPAAAPTILIRDPEGTAPISDSAMTVDETGVYSYVYQTTAGTSPEGVWRVRFKAVSGASTVLTPEVDAFELIP